MSPRLMPLLKAAGVLLLLIAAVLYYFEWSSAALLLCILGIVSFFGIELVRMRMVWSKGRRR